MSLKPIHALLIATSLWLCLALPAAASQADRETYFSSELAHITALPADIRFLAAEDELDQESSPEATEAAETADRQSRVGSARIFSFAMGERGGSCLTCDFTGYFMSSMIDFSQVIYDYFAWIFGWATPVMMLIWIGYRVAKMAALGGEDGFSFLKEIAMKTALFVLVFTLISGTSDRFAWRIAGPDLLSFAFDVSGAVRDKAFEMSAANTLGSSSTPYGCANVKSIMPGVTFSEDRPFLQSGMQIACVTERTHIVGFASGMAVALNNFTEADFGRSLGGLATGIFTGIMKMFVGLFIMVIFTISAIWLLFLILDVVVEIALMAALFPLLAAAYLWRPTRGFATNGLKFSIGAIVTAVGISIISILAYYLNGNIVTIYNATYLTVLEQNEGLNMSPIAMGSEIENLREFILRASERDPTKPSIPIHFGTPWFIYLCMTGVSIFALGKKLIAMLSQVVGIGGQSSLADNATKMAKSAAMLSLGTTALAGGAAAMASKPVGRAALGGASSAAGGAVSAGKNILAGARSMSGGGSKNTLDSVAGGRDNSAL